MSNFSIEQGCQTYGPRAESGPPSGFSVALETVLNKLKLSDVSLACACWHLRDCPRSFLQMSTVPDCKRGASRDACTSFEDLNVTYFTCTVYWRHAVAAGCDS